MWFVIYHHPLISCTNKYTHTVHSLGIWWNIYDYTYDLSYVIDVYDVHIWTSICVRISIPYMIPYMNNHIWIPYMISYMNINVLDINDRIWFTVYDRSRIWFTVYDYFCWPYMKCSHMIICGVHIWKSVYEFIYDLGQSSYTVLPLWCFGKELRLKISLFRFPVSSPSRDLLLIL